MKILLDTHILLWALTDDEHLPERARDLILDGHNEIYYSILSLWEIELKRLAHPQMMPVSSNVVAAYCDQSGYLQLPLRARHIFALSGLRRTEDAPSHKDPFDRMLICQASAEEMRFLTHDTRIAEYIEPCIMVV